LNFDYKRRYCFIYWRSTISLRAGVTSLSMIKPCLLGLIHRMLTIGAWGWLYTIVFSMGRDRGTLVLGLPKCISIIIIPETGAYMLCVLVWKPRWFLLFICFCWLCWNGIGPIGDVNDTRNWCRLCSMFMPDILAA